MADAWFHFGQRFRSRDRKHGEPFPLPRLSPSTDDVGTPLHALRQRVDQSLKSLNDLASVPFSAATTDLPLTSMQTWIMEDVWRRVSRHGEPPQMDSDEVLRDMAIKSNLYSQEAAHLVPMDLDKIKILKRQLHTAPVQSLLPPEVACYVHHFEDMIEKSEAELRQDEQDTNPVEPYWDPQLKRDFSKRLDLYKRLHSVGLLTFRKRRKGRVAFFTVRKKDGQQRLIVDARDPNSRQRRPPNTQLSTPSGFMELNFSDLDQGGCGEVLAIPSGALAAGDVGDCFYNFTIEPLSSWFCTDDRMTVSELAQLGFDVDSVYDDALGHRVRTSPDECLWFAFGGLCMGWSWALFLANEVVVHQSQLGSGLSANRFLRDKQPAPDLGAGPAVGVYVDNVNVVGHKVSDVQSTMNCISKRFADLGIPFEVTDEAGQSTVESLGLEFSFGKRVFIRNTVKRTWKIWHAVRAVLKRKRVSGELMRVLLGHINFFFQISRSALSSLSACYKFAIQSLGRRCPLWPNVRRELRIVLGLLMLAECELTVERSPLVHLGDSSTYGFSLMCTTADSFEIGRELRVREKWRFLEGREEPVLTEESDPDAIQKSGHVGHLADRSIGSSTMYGHSLRNRLEQINHRDLQHQKDRLFGKPKSKPRTLIEAIPHPPVSDVWHRQERWTLIHAAAWKDTKEHINVKEARVILMGLRRWARHAVHAGKLVFSLSDNLVSVLSFEKGRSSSTAMNSLCRRACAYVLGCRFTWRLRHIRTEFNVADGPSRRFDPKPRSVKGDLESSKTLGRHVFAHSLEQGPMGSPVTSAEIIRGQRGQFCLELFSGHGGLTAHLRRRHLKCFSPMDIRHGPMFDLTRTSTQRFLFWLLSTGLLWYVHLGTPCTVWSRARHSITNTVKARAKERLGVQLAVFTSRFISRAVESGILFTLENPWGSLLWRFPPIERLVMDSRNCLVVFDACMYGSLFRKSTALLTNIPSLLALSHRCDRSHHHEVLRGSWRVKRGGVWVAENKTSTAGAYPPQLCLHWSHLIAELSTSDCLGSDHDANQWFEMCLKTAASKAKFGLAAQWSSDAHTPNAVTAQEAQRFIDSGAVFGQHSKEEAMRRAGSHFTFKYPEPTTHQKG